MLVDLGRNDLGRVCESGCVYVDGSWRSRPTATSCTSCPRSSGRCARTSSAIDALRAVLPAGTLSGAPKIRAMEIIDELEPVKRGAYGGAVGYLSYAGELDTCIYIRTVVVKDGVAHIQAGGGTVADAKPDYEYEESRGQGAGAVAGGRAGGCAQADWPMRGPDGRQLRLVHLQPRPVPGRAGGRARGRAQRPRHGRRAARRAATDRVVVSPGPCTPDEAGISLEVDARASRRPACPTLGVCLGHQSLGAGVRRPRRAPRAGARQDDRDRARRRADLRRAPEPAPRRALPLACRRTPTCPTSLEVTPAAAAC